MLGTSDGDELRWVGESVRTARWGIQMLPG